MPGDASAKYLPEGVEVVYGDLLDIRALERFFEVKNNEEEIPIDPDRIRGCYSLSKALATNLVLKAVKEERTVASIIIIAV